MSPPPSFDTEELLAQISWVRALALRVAPDVHVAEDLTQDAMLVALRQRPDGTRDRPASLKQWLAAVVRNLGRTRHRSARRRTEREATVAAGSNGDLPTSTLELIERAALQRELVGAVLELDEPYRSALLMRFFEELSQREIAQRTGVPVSTVGTRIAEGIKRLRRKFGGRETWLSSILAVFRRPEGALLPAALTGAVVMSVQTKLILGSVVVVGAVLALQSGDSKTPVVPKTEPEVALAHETTPLDDAPKNAQRESVEVPVVEEKPRGFYDIPEHAGLTYHVMGSAKVQGRVIDVSGAPVGDVEVCGQRPRGLMDETDVVVPAVLQGCVMTDAIGRFEIESKLPFEVIVRDDRYMNVVQADVRDKSEAEVIVVVARHVPLRGVVVDENGSPVENVRISLQMRLDPGNREFSGSRPVRPDTRSDELGRFDIGGAAGVEQAWLQFNAAGFVAHILDVPEGGDGALQVVLLREAKGIYTVTGHVVLADGKPAVGAQVATTGFMATPTDDRGYFAINFEPWLVRVDQDAPTVVTATMPGILPATVTLPSVNEVRESGWPEEIVLTLAGEPLTIRGRVVDQDGNPLRRVNIELADPTPFGLVGGPGMPAFSGTPKSQEQMAGGRAGYTDADGWFELTGLLPRKYSVRAMLRPSLLTAVSDPVDAGDQDVLIALDQRALGTIAGRIVDRFGAGIPDVRISVSGKRPSELLIGAAGTTDADGYFEIENATNEPEMLRIEGATIVPELFRMLDEDDDLTALELKVGRRCRIQFDWGDWPSPDDQLFVLDENEEKLMMMNIYGGGIGEVPWMSVEKGLTGVVVVSDEARHAVVYREGEEVTRVQIKLTADEVNLVQL